jgi:hypothetical protein
MIRQITSFFLSLGLVCFVVQVGLGQELRPLSKAAPTTVENFLQEMFFLTGTSGSMILSGACKDEAGNVDKAVISDGLSNPPRGPFQNLGESITAVSRLAPQISWTLDKKGLMRVSDNRITDDVLRIVLRRVHFAKAADPNEAIRTILSAPEVQEYFKQNHIEQGTARMMPMNSKGAPRLSGDLHNVTVAEALDSIVKFFPGLWIYSECTSGSFRRVIVRGAEVGQPGGLPSRVQPDRH